MKTRKGMLLGTLVVGALCLGFQPAALKASDRFAELHRETAPITKDILVKKLLYLVGMMNAGYHGMNDMIAALQLVKETNDPKVIGAQLFAAKVGLDQKPPLFRHIGKEIATCESYPNFPLGFPDSPEGPEKISQEMFKIADSLENLNIKYDLTDIAALRKEVERVLFVVFWTESEKTRFLAGQLVHFLRKDLQEVVPFEPFQKPLYPKR